jgi:hypothetical protein
LPCYTIHTICILLIPVCTGCYLTSQSCLCMAFLPSCSLPLPAESASHHCLLSHWLDHT